MKRLLTLYSEVQSTDVRWLWYPFIAIGKITLLQGDPGDGKSTLMMNLIAELSTGGKTPDGCKIGAPQKVIYMRICSQQFIDRLVEANNFSPLEFHRVEGKYLPELNAVVFPIKVM
ncbi:AAA family ATPase [Faecalibacterium sp. AM43-5AT]|uniref:AAA family ATPase n=1 Tax=Faecalibacterium sp. AM43-5AT TaxID=2302957 RepID=UPI000E769B20|nr:AAA family ATPase [Faecalibacterium sp. AM43-5AT]RJV94671.1 hypothetical protein DW937_11825 [Faecalibacterium sp. AM43-5AT]